MQIFQYLISEFASSVNVLGKEGEERESEENANRRRTELELEETVLKQRQKYSEMENRSERSSAEEKIKVLVDEQKKQIEELEKEIKRREKTIEKYESTIHQMRRRTLDLQDQMRFHRNPSGN